MNKKKLVFEILLGWIFPGSCFILRKNYTRGFFFFIILNITFILGLCLKGGVIWPVWQYNAEGFNIVNILTFIGQTGNGFGLLISLFSSEIVIKSSELPNGALSSLLIFFAGKESNPFFDIASFFLLVSGTMNYFILTNFYDQYYKKEE